MGLAIRTAAVALAVTLFVGAAQAMDSGSMSMGPTPDELYRKAQRAVDAKRYRDAIAELDKIVKSEPKHANALNLLGYSHRKLGEYDLAVNFYTRALDADAKHLGANEYLGEAYLELNKLPEAEQRLARLNELCGGSCKEYKALAEAVDQYKAGKRPPQSSRASW